ncbi:hypothetical protein Val02_35160 [Virgisporangium aliadipatigenens]|uniref:Uncharacterized protein n=1 Tax=Virgisporangium aliadipatigenens TaxID=741659 RepID=A0A8J4DQ40_9ACTN|nr:immunity 49 family protein [Virgisporangium aliadipatigenens]GIJ46630.1 hypothetical protein Val02_35160 [Virgisporangium aliadipatigenens]
MNTRDRTEPHDPPTPLRASLRQLGSRMREDPDADRRETWDAAVTALRAAHAVLAAAGSAGGGASADDWLTACYLGMICRASSVLETLMNTQVKGSAEVDALQSYLRRGRVAEKKSEDPTIRALAGFLGGRAGPFAEALTHALEQHTRGGGDATGGVALGPLAVACAAFDRKFPIGVESALLPRNLVERRWREEIAVPPPASGRRTWRLVDRHEADAGTAEREGDALTARLDELIARDPSRLHVIGPTALRETGYRLVTDEPGSWIHTWDSLTLAMQAYHGIFAAATADGAEATVRLRDGTFRVPATGATPHTNADTWLRAMYLSMICRDRTRVDDLVRVPQELRRSSGTGHDAAVHEWIGVLHGYWYGGYSMSERSLAAVPPEDDLLRPTVELFYRISEDDQAGFTDALERALRRHRRYWTFSVERAQDPEGFLALAPLALAARAQQSGWLSVTVRSPYLPLTLLNGDRVGEGASR